MADDCELLPARDFRCDFDGFRDPTVGHGQPLTRDDLAVAEIPA
jgi:hypothetical protein